MTDQKTDDFSASPEQIAYADVLLIGVWVGIFILFVTYFIYVLGLVSPHVDIELIPQLWGNGVHEYLEATHSPSGWGWVSFLHRSDFMTFVGLSLLALLTIVCYLILVKGYIRKRDWIYSILCILEIIVLSVAASGILGRGGH